MLEEFGRVGFLLIFALAFPLIPIVASVAFGFLRLRPKQPDPVKSSTYECGVETVGDAWGQFHARYYVYALVFVVFDVEVLLLYPWAVSFGTVGVGGFVAGALFLLILTAGFAYDWAKKALEWF